MEKIEPKIVLFEMLKNSQEFQCYKKLYISTRSTIAILEVAPTSQTDQIYFLQSFH